MARGFQDVFPLSHDKIRNGNDLVMYVILFNWFALICYICLCSFLPDFGKL